MHERTSTVIVLGGTGGIKTGIAWRQWGEVVNQKDSRQKVYMTEMYFFVLGEPKIMLKELATKEKIETPYLVHLTVCI